MNNGKRRITMIPPKPEMDLGKASRRQLRVAAYCGFRQMTRNSLPAMMHRRLTIQIRL